jgi:hypothetical protein
LVGVDADGVEGDHQCDGEDEEHYSSGSENSSTPFGWDSPGKWYQGMITPEDSKLMLTYFP